MSPIGPGKYDEACSVARLSTSARGAILLIIDGAQGSGFSVQADVDTTLRLPEILEHTAKEIRASLRAGQV